MKSTFSGAGMGASYAGPDMPVQPTHRVMYGRPPLGKGFEQDDGWSDERSCIRFAFAVG